MTTRNQRSKADKESRFIQEYLIDLNPGDAAMRAGLSRSAGSALLAKDHIQEQLAGAFAARAERTQITQDKVLERWWEIATADPNELIQYRRVCCRYCHGNFHQYQWRDDTEFNNAMVEAFEAKADELPSDMGGYGFCSTVEPHPDCPQCDGEGYGSVYGADTRKLPPAGRALYAGVKKTRDGFEIKLQDQGKALENVARHLGMFKGEGGSTNINFGVGLEHFYGGKLPDSE